MTPGLAMAGAFSLLCALVSLYLARAVEAQSRLHRRVAAIQRMTGLVEPSQRSSSNLLLRLVSAVGTAIARSGALSEKTLSELQQTLVVAGFRSHNGLGLFVGSKILLFVVLPLLAWFGLGKLETSPSFHNGGTFGCAVLGLIAPDFIIKKIRAGYLARLGNGLPDSLDMMVICSEAGLGLEPSISRVAVEIAHTHPAVAAELFQTASELRIISDRRLALQNMGTRTGLEGLKRLGATLIQTSQYGTPVSQALRTLSAEMRNETLTRFEQRAARLPVLLTVPMIVFVLPTVFVVVAGPAMLRVIATLHP